MPARSFLALFKITGGSCEKNNKWFVFIFNPEYHYK